jgi:hypothetical protein
LATFSLAPVVSRPRLIRAMAQAMFRSPSVANPAVERTCAKSRAGRSLLRYNSSLASHFRSACPLGQIQKFNLPTGTPAGVSTPLESIIPLFPHRVQCASL